MSVYLLTTGNARLLAIGDVGLHFDIYEFDTIIPNRPPHLGARIKNTPSRNVKNLEGEYAKGFRIARYRAALETCSVAGNCFDDHIRNKISQGKLSDEASLQEIFAPDYGEQKVFTKRESRELRWIWQPDEERSFPITVTVEHAYSHIKTICGDVMLAGGKTEIVGGGYKWQTVSVRFEGKIIVFKGGASAANGLVLTSETRINADASNGHQLITAKMVKDINVFMGIAGGKSTSNGSVSGEGALGFNINLIKDQKDVGTSVMIPLVMPPKKIPDIPKVGLPCALSATNQAMVDIPQVVF